MPFLFLFMSLMFPATIMLFVVGFYVIKYPSKGLLNCVDLQELSKIEGSLYKSGLRDVIVVTNQIDVPHDNLRESVQSNFRNGVKYIFLVPESSYEQESQDGYFRFFKTMAINCGASQNLLIEKLPEDIIDTWDKYPWVFYRLQEKDNKNDEINTIAFRGNKINEGICETYFYIEPDVAKMFAKLLMSLSRLNKSNLLQEIDQLGKDNFIEPDKVVSNLIPFPSQDYKNKA